MQNEKIQSLIDDENLRLERNMGEEARQIVRYISNELEAIESHKFEIEKLRAKLKSLEVKPLEISKIIG